MNAHGQDDEGDRIPAVPYVPFSCPICGRHKPRTHGVRGRMRYHCCRSCGTKYRSFEVPRDLVVGWEGGRIPDPRTP